MQKLKITIIGASGYVAIELIRILRNHPKATIDQLIANTEAGKEISEIYSHLSNADLPKMISLEEADFSEIDVVFSCLPHCLGHEIIQEIYQNNSHLKIIDLSADFRFGDIRNYEKWYQQSHKAPKLQKYFIYGLSEFNRNKIAKANLVACPGCYPTSTLLPLLPLVELGLISSNNIIIDAKSGVSGAGRSLKQGNLFCEINENLKPYSITNHRHIGEIEQELNNVSHETGMKISFTPNLIPISRGMLSIIYVDIADKLKFSDLQNTLETKFADEYFVEVVTEIPTIKDVVNSNLCKIGVFSSRLPNKAIIISVIDNLTKGSSGQAVQNMNIMYDFDERMGLNLSPIFP